MTIESQPGARGWQTMVGPGPTLVPRREDGPVHTSIKLHCVPTGGRSLSSPPHRSTASHPEAVTPQWSDISPNACGDVRGDRPSRRGRWRAAPSLLGPQLLPGPRRQQEGGGAGPGVQREGLAVRTGAA